MTDITTYTVKNTSPVAKAFKVRGGHKVVAAGTEAEVTNARSLTEAQLDAFAREGVKVAEKKARADKGEKTSGPQAIHRGAGSYSVMDGDQELVERLTKEEAEGFNELGADAKAQFITGRKAA